MTAVRAKPRRSKRPAMAPQRSPVARRPRPPAASSRAEATRDRLIDATLALLETHSVAGISVRDVATRAGVNHGLVHRYFGSKDELIRQAVRRTAALVYDAETPPRASWFFERLLAHPEAAILVARACLDGPHDLLAMAAPPPELLDRLVARLAPPLARTGLGLDANVINALFSSALLGWIVFRPMLGGYRLPADADARLAAMIAMLDRLLDTPIDAAQRP